MCRITVFLPCEALNALVSFPYNYPVTNSDASHFSCVFMVLNMIADMLLYGKAGDKIISDSPTGPDGSFLYVDHLTIRGSRLQMGFNMD